VWFLLFFHFKKLKSLTNIYKDSTLKLKTSKMKTIRFSKGPHRVGATPPPFYLKTEAEPVSETLFLKKKSLDNGQSPKARFFEIVRFCTIL
jgi:hypothetical protein